MSMPTVSFPTENLLKSGLTLSECIQYSLSPEELIQYTLRLGEGVLNDTVTLVINTGEFTGRSPKDKFIVKDEVTSDSVYWNDINNPIEEKFYHIIYKK